MIQPRKRVSRFQRLWIVFVGAMALSTRGAQGQKAPADSIQGLLESAETAYQQETGEAGQRAEVLYRAALKLAVQTRDRLNQGQALLGMGRVQAGQGNPDSAAALFNRARSAFQEVGAQSRNAVVMNDLGLMLVRFGEPDSGLALLRASLAIDRDVDPKEAGTTLGNLGMAFYILGATDSATFYVAASAAAAQEVGDSAGVASQLVNLGAILARRGIADSAILAFEQGLPLLRALGNAEGQSIVLQNLGATYNGLGQPDTAIALLRGALAISQTLGDPDAEAGLLHELGMVFRNQHLADSALHYLRPAYEMAQQAHDPLLAGTALNNIGLTLQDLGQYDSALAVYRAALPLRQAAGDSAGLGVTLGNIGAALNQLHLPDSALLVYRPALALTRATRNRRAEAYTLGNIARSYEALRHPSVAVSYYDSAATVIDAISRRAGNDPQRVGFTELIANVLDPWPFTWLDLADSVGPEQASLNSLGVVERMRGQALLALLRHGGDSLAKADNQLAVDRMVAALQRDGSTALVYVPGAKRLGIWVISPDRPVQAFVRSISEDSLAMLVQRMRRGLGVGATAASGRGVALDSLIERGLGWATGGDSWEASAVRLADVLIPAELSATIERAGDVIVVPSGPLALLPFAALSLPDHRLLGQAKAIRYATSLATLVEIQSRKGIDPRATHGLQRSLVVGNPAMPLVRHSDGTQTRLPGLPGAEREARDIAGRLHATFTTGNASTEHSVRAALPSAPLVHFATHGYAYAARSRARESFIALAAGDGEDGLLTAGEIVDDPNLTLVADLVVLSACQTGLGDPTRNEGTIGLQRAFLARGARSVLVSLWNVSDEATRLLMESFYQHWLDDRDHPTKAEALRRAENDVKRTRGFEDPRFWAAFQLVGAN